MPKQPPDEQVPIDITEIASAIARLDAAVTKIQKSGVSTRLLVLMINDATGGKSHGVSFSNIERVLAALPELRSTYLGTGKDKS